MIKLLVKMFVNNDFVTLVITPSKENIDCPFISNSSLHDLVIDLDQLPKV